MDIIVNAQDLYKKAKPLFPTTKGKLYCYLIVNSNKLCVAVGGDFAGVTFVLDGVTPQDELPNTGQEGVLISVGDLAVLKGIDGDVRLVTSTPSAMAIMQAGEVLHNISQTYDLGAQRGLDALMGNDLSHLGMSNVIEVNGADLKKVVETNIAQLNDGARPVLSNVQFVVEADGLHVRSANGYMALFSVLPILNPVTELNTFTHLLGYKILKHITKIAGNATVTMGIWINGLVFKSKGYTFWTYNADYNYPALAFISDGTYDKSITISTAQLANALTAIKADLKILDGEDVIYGLRFAITKQGGDANIVLSSVNKASPFTDNLGNNVSSEGNFEIRLCVQGALLEHTLKVFSGHDAITMAFTLNTRQYNSSPIDGAIKVTVENYPHTLYVMPMTGG